MSTSTTDTAETFTITSAEGRIGLVNDFEGAKLTAAELVDALALFEDDAPEGCSNGIRILVGESEVTFEAGIEDLDAFEGWLLAA